MKCMVLCKYGEPPTHSSHGNINMHLIQSAVTLPYLVMHL